MEGNDDQQPEAKARWLNQRNFETVLDERIRAAQAAGMFDNLPGAGKPLSMDDDSLVPEEDRAAYRMLKNAGFGPPWLELRRQIEAEQEKLAQWQSGAARKHHTGAATLEELRGDLECRIQALNRLIKSYNLMVPPVIGQLPLIQLWRELQKLEQQG